MSELFIFILTVYHFYVMAILIFNHLFLWIFLGLFCIEIYWAMYLTLSLTFTLSVLTI